MKLFSEIYGNYYKAVSRVIEEAQAHPLTLDEIRTIITEYAFADSPLYIIPKLTDGSWPLLNKTDLGYVNSVSMPEHKPLSTIQKRWLASILTDPRIGLFLNDEDLTSLRDHLADIKPLYSNDDFYIYDSAKDGDNYSDPEYRRKFKIILDAINMKEQVYILYSGKRGKSVDGNYIPHKLEYSPKDDKFRLLCAGTGKKAAKEYVFNMNRIDKAECTGQKQNDTDEHYPIKNNKPQNHTVKFEITEERNALERVLVQFANYEKSTMYDEENSRYICTMKYNSMDETEVLIMLLSFGPTIRITGPGRFLKQIKERVRRQDSLLNNT